MTVAASLTGMSRTTGAALSGIAHLEQSLGDLISTPLGTRVMRRDYGCLMFDLLDAPLHAATGLLCVNAIAMAVTRWEPRLTLTQVLLSGDVANGQPALTLVGTDAQAPDPNSLVTLSIPLS